MKALIIAALTAGLVQVASAEVIGLIPTDEGGGVRMLSTPCTAEGYETWKLAYLVGKSGRVLPACWTYDGTEKAIAVRYIDGDLYLYQSFIPAKKDPES
jgi:hypothetical protein